MSTCEFTITESGQMVDLEEYLDYLVRERCNELGAKITSRDVDYRNLQAEMEDYLGKLHAVLPEPVQKENFIESLWLFTGRLELLIQKLVYKQGLKDGVRLKSFLELK